VSNTDLGHTGFLRVVDANLNRAREGLRVCEEVTRMILNDPGLTRRYQRFRYSLNSAAKFHPAGGLLKARDPHRDVGRPQRRGMISPHRGYQGLVLANMKRVEEALRVLEEFTRLKNVSARPHPQRLKLGAVSRAFGMLRFHAYCLEQDLLSKLSAVYDR